MSPKLDPHIAGRLFVLDLSGGRVLSMKTDGSDETVIAEGCHLPDGIAIETRAGHVYWTNMGVPSREDGSIELQAVDANKDGRVTLPELQSALEKAREGGERKEEGKKKRD